MFGDAIKKLNPLLFESMIVKEFQKFFFAFTYLPSFAERVHVLTNAGFQSHASERTEGRAHRVYACT